MTAPGGAARRRLVVRGVVQGVGFRPHVARLAADLGLTGSCRNDATGVVLEVEGDPAAVASFERRLVSDAPPLARIESVVPADVPPAGSDVFVIEQSTAGAGERTMVPPDTAVCDDCLRELGDPADRRYRHPFITCTNCGPRLTITLDLPYDRPVTTMAGFPMCPACAAEYADRTDRRYHAQPIACHDCGPTLRLDDAWGRVEGEDALAGAVTHLQVGGIVAVKGIGGYHLACDASNPHAVARLRERKHRPDQPFAVMARDLDVAAGLVELAPDAARLLAGPERPIVLLRRRSTAGVADSVAPGLDELGVLLPYAPLHHLLFAALADGAPGAPAVLVMTSGNQSGEPLCHRDDDAKARLGGLADAFLTHDREIAVPVEDSVVAWSDDVGPVPIRRSRGFAPLPVDLLPVGPSGDAPARGPVVLAAGAELKNTVALVRGGRAHVSAHVGDLESLASREAHQRVTDQLLGFHRSRPDLLVADLHPGYASRAWAQQQATAFGVPLLEVQHHHAHLAALAAEHGRLDEPLLGLVYDGTGYGCDATVWGGELLLLGDAGCSAERLGHLGTIRLPGADAGVRNPVRTAALALLAAGVPLAASAVGEQLSEVEAGFLARAHASGSGVVDTSSVGRLFDMVASVLGIRHRITYEAQAAVELEAAARTWRRTSGDPGSSEPLPFPVVTGPTGLPVLDPGPLVRALVTSYAAGMPAGELAWAFHQALATASAELALGAAERTGVTTVGLSGGVFVNRLLLAASVACLRERGLQVLTHARVPANDGGLALGQAAVGHRHLLRGTGPARHPVPEPARP